MLTPAAVEPFRFFSWESLGAGWYLTWRLFIRVIPAGIIVGVVAALFARSGGALGGFLVALGIVAALIWSIMLVPRLTSQWARQRYGQALDGALGVWWGITWRSVVVSLVAAVIMAVPNVVALSLKTAYPHSALGTLGGLLISVMSLINIVVSVLATGWAMSRVAAAQIVGLGPSPSVTTEPAAVRPAGGGTSPVEVPVVATAPRPVAASPAAAPPEAKMQCPKCGLYETEHGSVIGWYCKVCGWRQTRR